MASPLPRPRTPAKLSPLQRPRRPRATGQHPHVALISSLPPWAQDARGPGHVAARRLGVQDGRQGGAPGEPRRAVGLRGSWISADAAASSEDTSG